jgi:hypothetical protein
LIIAGYFIKRETRQTLREFRFARKEKKKKW